MRGGGLASGVIQTPTFRRSGIRSPRDKLRYTTGTGRTYFWPFSANDSLYSTTVGLWYFQPQDLISYDLSNTAAALKDYSSLGTKHLSFTTASGTTYAPALNNVAPLFGTHSGHVSGTNCGGFRADLPAFGTGDFTIEIIGNALATAATFNIIDMRPIEPSTTIAVYYYAVDNSIRMYVGGADRIISAASVAVTTGRWMLVISRVSGNTRMYYGAYTAGGAIPQVGSTYVDANNYVVGNGFVLGGPYLNLVTNSWLYDIVRVSQGVGGGRYSGASLTAPSEPYPPY